MTDNLTTLLVAFIAALPPTVASVLAAVAAWQAMKKAAAVDAAVHQVHLIVNSQRDALETKIESLHIQLTESRKREHP